MVSWISPVLFQVSPSRQRHAHCDTPTLSVIAVVSADFVEEIDWKNFAESMAREGFHAG
jgi:hypothetical protein